MDNLQHKGSYAHLVSFIKSYLIGNLCAGSIAVSISAFQADDPGSNPGWRI